MPSFGYPRGVSQSARICPETRQREERGQIGRRKRRRITCSCWGQGHASTMIRGVIPQEVELTGEIGGWKPRPRGDYNRGPKPLPGGLGGWKPRPREPGARATAGRTRGLEATAESSRSIGPISLCAVEQLPALVASRLAGPDAGLTARRAGGGARLRTLAPVALQPDEVARWVGADHERRGVAVADACALLRERGADGADEGIAAGVDVDEVVVRVGGTPAV